MAGFLRRPADGGDAAGVEGDGRRVPDAVDLVREVVAGAGRGDRLADLGLDGVDDGGFRVADVDREPDLARDDVARRPGDADVADRDDGVRGVTARDLVHRGDGLGGRDQRVLARRHRGRAGVALLAGDRDIEPADALAAGDDADHLALGLEHRALLDVQLEVALPVLRSTGQRPAVADAFEFVAEALAVAVGAAV